MEFHDLNSRFCIVCKHFRGWNTELGWICEAFSGGIPADIADYDYDHRDPYPDDNGIQFEPLDNQEFSNSMDGA